MSDLLLISVSGNNKPEWVSAFSTILTQYKAVIQDDASIVGGESFSCALILDASDVGHPLIDEVRRYCDKRGWLCQKHVISDKAAHSSKPNDYVLTVMSGQRMAKSLLAIMKSLKPSGLILEAMSFTSAHQGKALTPSIVLELNLMDDGVDISSFRKTLLDIAGTETVDAVIQESQLYHQNKRLAVFDMDSTLIDAEVIDLLAEAAGVGDAVADITERAMQGELDFKESFTQRLSMLQGLDVSCLQRIAENIAMNDGAEALMAGLKQRGIKTAIISGGFEFFARYLQKKLGIDEVFANALDIENGVVTGKVSGDIIDGDRKALLLQALATREGLSMDQVVAVGDGANDLPMLRLAGLGVAFRAKPLVKQSARQSVSLFGLDAIDYLLGGK